MVSEGPVLEEREDRVAWLTLNRPDRRNALSRELLEALLDRLEALSRDPGVSVVVIGAQGSTFSAGHDLRELRDGRLEDNRRLFELCTQVMERIQSLPQPVIAMVQGVATAAGCQLVASCDLAVAAESARFATPGVRIGYFCITPMVPLCRNVGRKKAMEMLLTGDFIHAHEALSCGLVNQVVPDSELRTRTRDLARKIARTPLRVLAEGKRAFYHQIERDQQAAYALAREVMASTALYPEAQEGIRAFLEKRPPSWISQGDSE
jgi:enoyl-CoA hydratase/carnithine racemase